VRQAGQKQKRTNAESRSDVKRLLFRTCVFLLLGAIINVALAWACVLWPSQGRATSMPSDWATDQLKQAFGQSLQFDTVIGTISSGRGVFAQSCSGVDNRIPPGKAYMWVDICAGLPAKAFHCETTVKGAPPATTTGLVAPAFLSRYGTALPIEPIWLGFVMNTMVLGVAAWIVIGLLKMTTGHLRTLRNRCEKCGYSLTGNTSGRCPECGAEAI
jgi:hypothetical protein